LVRTLVLVQKGHLTLRLTYHSTTIILIFASMPSSLPHAYWGGTYHFQASPVTLGLNPYLDSLFLLYGIVRIFSLTAVKRWKNHAF